MLLRYWFRLLSEWVCPLFFRWMHRSGRRLHIPTGCLRLLLMVLAGLGAAQVAAEPAHASGRGTALPVVAPSPGISADTTESPRPTVNHDGLLRINHPLHDFLERQQTLGRLPRAVLSHKPLSRGASAAVLDSLDTRRDMLSPAEQQHLDRYQRRTARPGAARGQQWGAFANGYDLISARGTQYAIQATPVMYGALGPVTQRNLPGEASTAWQGTVGARTYGRLGRYVFFDVESTATRERPPRVDFNTPGRPTAPRQGKVTLHGDTYGYADVRGVVGLRTRFFELRAGRDRNRWGPGSGSVMLSNYGPAHNQVQLRTTVGRVQYTNLFSQYAAPAGPSAPDETPDFSRRPRSYGATHRLALRVSDRVELGAFETIVFAPERDSTVNRGGFDVAYLNPIVFLRGVERELGSPDRALVGIDGAWTVMRGLRLYGQFVLDEFVASEIGNQWWGNKWAWTLGAHWVPPAVPNLSVRGEFARLRPHIYAHTYVPNSYAHWDDGLGHPAGPNSIDMAVQATYDPASAWRAGFNVAYTRRGRNTDTENFGADPTRSNQTRVRSRGVTMLQGVRQNRLMGEAHIGMEVLPQLVLEAAVRAEHTTDAARPTTTYVTPHVAIRWGLPFQSLRY